ncbi:hypothetical protein CPB86DRAFT_627001 [Serendipita vermifera]|nr:hypothetical protein CPB86DRAFT_627001 [Serendipita vermifera]
MTVCHINALPVELLQSIFIEFWLSESGSPTELLSVCRHWEATALNTKVLWTKIRFGVDNRKGLSPAYVTCVSAEELLRRLRFIEGMKFDFCAAVVPRRSLKDSLCHSTRSQFRNCRSFQVIRYSADKVLRLLTDVSSLEELRVEYVDYDEVQRLFERLDRPEANLKSLHFEGYLGQNWWQFKTMFSRLQEFSFTNLSIQPRWAGQYLFSNLKALLKLEFNHSGRFYTFRDVFKERLDVVSPTLQELTLRSSFLQCFTHSSFQNIIKMSIHSTVSTWDDRSTPIGDPVVFPLLKTLLISGGWHSLKEIVAPCLSILTLEHGNYNWDLSANFLAVTQLRPQTICAQKLYRADHFLSIISILGSTALEIQFRGNLDSPWEALKSKMQEMRKMGKIVRWNGIILPEETPI